MALIDKDQLKKFKEALADIIVSSQGLCTYDACKDVAERETTYLISMLLPEPNIQSSNIKETIRKEIERQVTHTMQCMGGKITGEPVLSARKLLAFLDTLEADAPEGLEEAKEAYCNEHNDDCFDATGDTCPHIRKAFIAGAEWQKEQDLAEMAQSKSPLSVAYANRCFENGKQAMKEEMMKEAVDGVVMDFSSNLPRPQVDIRLDPGKYHTGDKVRVIVIKEDKK